MWNFWTDLNAQHYYEWTTEGKECMFVTICPSTLTCMNAKTQKTMLKIPIAPTAWLMPDNCPEICLYQQRIKTRSCFYHIPSEHSTQLGFVINWIILWNIFKKLGAYEMRDRKVWHLHLSHIPAILRNWLNVFKYLSELM